LEIEELDLTIADVDLMLEGLRFKHDAIRPWVARNLHEQARNYLGNRAFLASLARGEALRDALDDTAAKLQSALNALDTLPFNAQMIVEWYCEEQKRHNPKLSDVRRYLANVTDALRKVRANLSDKPVRRLPRFALNVAVGSMMLVLEMATGTRALARRRQAGMTNPTFVNSEARVIGQLLKRVDPMVADTTLVNQIAAIGTRYTAKSLEQDFGPALLFGAPVKFF